MKRMNSSTVFMIALLLLIGALVIGAISFFNGMSSQYILIQQGISPVKFIQNHHAYLQNKRGFIFSLSFLTMSLSFFIMIALPSEEGAAKSKVTPTPEPKRVAREESDISAVVEQKPAEETEPEKVVPTERKAEAAEAVIDDITQEETFEAEMFDEVKEGEDDVVYGEGPISDAAIIHFVHKFPDSALKFLYRKQLDGKALNSTDEDIYQGWEKRQMTRGKVKSYIQTLMDWNEFPKRPLYEIWKEIRDHIFENVDI